MKNSRLSQNLPISINESVILHFARIFFRKLYRGNKVLPKISEFTVANRSVFRLFSKQIFSQISEFTVANRSVLRLLSKQIFSQNFRIYSMGDQINFVFYHELLNVPVVTWEHNYSIFASNCTGNPL